jgi:ribosomal protein S18 acetylase RimI-like enzyme
MKISIKPYTSEQSQQVLDLFHELQLHEHQFDTKKSLDAQDEAQYLQELVQTVAEKSGEVLVAVQDGVCVGFIAWYLENEPEFSQTYGYISDIVVAQHFRGKGIGQQLLDLAITHIRETSVKRVHIGCLLENTDTKKFYEKNGFAEYCVEMVRNLD